MISSVDMHHWRRGQPDEFFLGSLLAGYAAPRAQTGTWQYVLRRARFRLVDGEPSSTPFSETPAVVVDIVLRFLVFSLHDFRFDSITPSILDCEQLTIDTPPLRLLERGTLRS